MNKCAVALTVALTFAVIYKYLKKRNNGNLVSNKKIMHNDLTVIKTNTQKIDNKQNTENLTNNKEINTLLIDGSNLIRRSMYETDNNQPDYKIENNYLFPKLYSKIIKTLTAQYDRIVIFLDGKKRFFKIDKSQNIQVEFSGIKKADDLIVNDIAMIKNMQPNINKNVTLVSEDRELIRRCKEEFKNLNIIKCYKLTNILGIQKKHIFNYAC